MPGLVQAASRYAEENSEQPVHVTCTRCGKEVAVKNGFTVTHGPGPDENMICPGSRCETGNV